MYMIPLQASHRFGVPCLEKEEINAMFYGLEPIIKLNREMLTEIQLKIAVGRGLGKVMLTFAPSMKLYIDYYNVRRERGDSLNSLFLQHYDKAQMEISRVMEKNTTFKSFLMATKNEPECKKRDIIDFLITPIQRIPRYGESLSLSPFFVHIFSSVVVEGISKEYGRNTCGF